MDRKIKIGRTNVTRDKGVGRPSTGITQDNIECVREMVLLDRPMTSDEVAHIFYKLAMVRPTK